VSPAGRPSLRETLLLHRARIALLFVLIVAIYFLVAFAEQAWRARQLQAQAAQQRAAIEVLDHENAALRTQLDDYDTDLYFDYVQQRARRDLNLANPGETVLLVGWAPPQTTPEVASPPAAEEDERPNWRQWLDVFSED
jgi:cell division protein FtsB